LGCSSSSQNVQETEGDQYNAMEQGFKSQLNMQQGSSREGYNGTETLQLLSQNDQVQRYAQHQNMHYNQYPNDGGNGSVELSLSTNQDYNQHRQYYQAPAAASSGFPQRTTPQSWFFNHHP
jgi:hypothetical protein